MVPLIQDPQGRILVGAKPRGAGWIGGTLIESPSQWQFDNEPESYAGYWALLFEKLARRSHGTWRLITAGAPMSGHPVDLTLSGPGEPGTPIIAFPDGSVDSLALVQDLIDPERWWTRFWPSLPGWYEVTNTESQSYSFYVTDSMVDPVRAASRIAATSRRVNAATAAAADTDRHLLRSPFPRIWSFFLLILALAYLWAEDRGLIPTWNG